jgi:hypothetical protein
LFYSLGCTFATCSDGSTYHCIEVVTVHAVPELEAVASKVLNARRGQQVPGIVTSSTLQTIDVGGCIASRKIGILSRGLLQTAPDEVKR